MCLCDVFADRPNHCEECTQALLGRKPLEKIPVKQASPKDYEDAEWIIGTKK